MGNSVRTVQSQTTGQPVSIWEDSATCVPAWRRVFEGEIQGWQTVHAVQTLCQAQFPISWSRFSIRPHFKPGSLMLFQHTACDHIVQDYDTLLFILMHSSTTVLLFSNSRATTVYYNKVENITTAILQQKGNAARKYQCYFKKEA